MQICFILICTLIHFEKETSVITTQTSSTSYTPSIMMLVLCGVEPTGSKNHQKYEKSAKPNPNLRTEKKSTNTNANK